MNDVARARLLGLVLSTLVSGCSQDESAPPAAGGCSGSPAQMTCRRANGACVPLRCVDEAWQCASGETLTVVATGRCAGPDAGSDAGDD